MKRCGSPNIVRMFGGGQAERLITVILPKGFQLLRDRQPDRAAIAVRQLIGLGAGQGGEQQKPA